MEYSSQISMKALALTVQKLSARLKFQRIRQTQSSVIRSKTLVPTHEKVLSHSILVLNIKALALTFQKLLQG